MIFSTEYFDTLVAALKMGGLPEGPGIGSVCTIKGQKVQVEQLLSQNTKVLKSLDRLGRPDVRYHFVDVPARRILGPLCLLALLVNGRLVDVFMVEYNGHYVIVSMYCDEPKAAFALIDELRAVNAAN